MPRRGAFCPFLLGSFPRGHDLEHRGEGCGRVSQVEENIAGYYRQRKQLEPHDRDQALHHVFGKLQGISRRGGQVPEMQAIMCQWKGRP